ncbi:Curculin domain-containing protein (mannose-binding) lectin [Streptomyces sp. NPDC101181]|uniref:Curculin domain-containing protein (mannose-binding) lectin n=1 Tax=Streptomyces sp. NPDC101181 TaxID=3366125 RepID=UPI0037F31F45
MREMSQFTRLYPDDQLDSPSGRFVMRCDAAGVAVITDTNAGEVVWRAGAAGHLHLGSGDEVLVSDVESGATLWRSEFSSPGAQYLILTDEGDLELLDHRHIRLSNIRTGPIHSVALGDAAPASAITGDAYMYHQDGTKFRTLVREQDGLLRWHEYGKGPGLSGGMAGPLVDWLAQENTQLTWHGRGSGKRKLWTLCLIDSGGAVLWRNERNPMPDGPVDVGTPYPYGGSFLEVGGRLRNQSLTSPDGTHTLVHQCNGDLALHCHTAHRIVWRTATDWVNGGWAELGVNGDLLIRNIHGARVWSSGTEDSGACQLIVRDDGRAELLDSSGRAVWSTGPHPSCDASAIDTPRGAVMRRGQTLGPHSLTSADGGTVLGHYDDRRLVLFSADHTWLWYRHLGEAAEPGLHLGEDGMLRVLGDAGPPLGGPADELRVRQGEVVLCRADGAVVWRNGEKVADPVGGPAEPSSDSEDTPRTE